MAQAKIQELDPDLLCSHDTTRRGAVGAARLVGYNYLIWTEKIEQ